MSLGASIAIIAVSALVGAAVMALLHGRAPAGGAFRDNDRAAGILGVLGGGFAIVLGFVVLLAFQNYSSARERSADEASAVQDMFETTSLFAPAPGDALRGDLVCYARAVIADEWPRLAAGRSSPLVDRWVLRAERRLDALPVRDARERVGFDQLFTARNARDRARHERLEEAAAVVPRILWVMLFIAGGSTLVFLLCFADPGERRWAQCLAMAIVAALVSSALLGVRFLDSPFGGHEGAIAPSDMTAALAHLTREAGTPPPCDGAGRPVAAALSRG